MEREGREGSGYNDVNGKKRTERTRLYIRKRIYVKYKRNTLGIKRKLHIEVIHTHTHIYIWWCFMLRVM